MNEAVKDKEPPFDSGILQGVCGVIDEWFQIGAAPFGEVGHFYQSDNPMKLIQQCPPDRSATELSQNIHRKIADNFRNAKRRSTSKQLWRWKQNIGGKLGVGEVGLERSIIGLNSNSKDWVNQVPVASGLCGSNADRKRSIDLVRKRGDCEFDFIELKLDDKNPLFAAMEILCYGVLYLFCRRNNKDIPFAPGSQLRDAKIVHLCVLAPAKFYPADERESLAKFETLLSRGVKEFAKDEVEMDFRFDQFPNRFHWPTSKELREALENIQHLEP